MNKVILSKIYNVNKLFFMKQQIKYPKITNKNFFKEEDSNK